jgi:hypothetical protein
MKTKTFSKDFIYNLGKSSEGQRVYYSGAQIVNAYNSGRRFALTKQQRGKLRKIARRILQKEKDE